MMIHWIIVSMLISPLAGVHWCRCHAESAEGRITAVDSDLTPVCGCHHCEGSDRLPAESVSASRASDVNLSSPCCCERFDRRPEPPRRWAIATDQGVAVAMVTTRIVWLPIPRPLLVASAFPGDRGDDSSDPPSLQTCRRLSRWLI